MVCITHFVVSAFLIVSSPFGTSSGFSISSRDSDLSPPPSSSSLSSISVTTTSSTTGSPTKGIDSAKTQIVLNTADQQHQTSLNSAAASAAAQHVPLDTASVSGSRSSSGTRTVSVVKREVSSMKDGEDEGKITGLYDPSLMIMSKRSAAALNKLMLALRSFDEPSSSSSYENSLEGANKETSGRFPKVGFRTSGSGIQFEPFSQNGLQRRGQKDRKIYLRCYFNAVSCFRRRK